MKELEDILGTRLHLDLQPGQRVYFTSDLHFGHKNVIQFCNRPFADVNEMTKTLIDNWNGVVSESDTIFVLGDFSWWDSNTEIKKLLKRLQGTIYLLPGNHDSSKGFRELPENVHLLGAECTVWITNIYPEKPNKPLEIYLSHCPMMSWPHRSQGVINLFGHIHSGERRTSSTGYDLDLPLWPGQQYDVGVDNNNYTPVSLQEIYSKLNRTL